MWGAIIGGALSLVGGKKSEKAAQQASDTQAEAAREATAEQRRQFDLSSAEQRRMFELTRQDQAPFRETGVAGNKYLARLLGLDVPTELQAAGVTPVLTPYGGGAAPAAAAPAAAAPTFALSTPPPPAAAPYTPTYDDNGFLNAPPPQAAPTPGSPVPTGVPTSYQSGQTNDPIWEDLLTWYNQQHTAKYGQPMNRPWHSDANPADYNQLIEVWRQRTAEKAAADAAAQAPAAAPAAAPAVPLPLQAPVPANPAAPAPAPVEGVHQFGELLKKFSTADLNADPVYQAGLQFGLDEGRKGINARAIAGGGYDSGATLKALTRYATDYGSTKANEAYGRFSNDQSNIYNKLAGISGAGQTATGAVGAAGQNMANQISGLGANYGNNVADLATQAGNARAAGIVGGANAWNNALGGIQGGYNAYQDRNMLDRIFNNRGGYGGGGGYNTYGRDD